ncbi:MAG TPA: TonB family protein [Gallionella sp.]|nr:TonB family protein [Gallionella sp.]
MRFHLDFRTSDSGRLTIALLFSLVLHALLLIYVRFAQPGWNSASGNTPLHVILEKNVAEVAPPAGIPAATRKSKGKATVGVQVQTPVLETVPAPRETRPTVTLAQPEPRKTESPKVPSEEKILSIEKPAKFAVPESKAEVPITKPVPPEVVEEKTKPEAPIPSVENLAPKTTPPVEEPKKIVAVAPAPEKAQPETPRPAPAELPKREEPKPPKVEEPKPVKIEAPKPPKVEEVKPVRVEEPKPVKIEEPKPAKVEEPKPVRIEEPKVARVEEPKPAKTEETKPAKVEEPKVAKAEPPKPVKVEEAAPPKVEEPKPVKSEIAASPKPSYGIGKSEGSAVKSSVFGQPSGQSDFGAGGIRGLPKIAERSPTGGERRKIIGSKEQELRYVMYKQSVVMKLQRLGQLNYPTKDGKSLSGKLGVQISIRADGSLEDVSIVRPSPEKALNDAAEKVVRMCAPFSPLPDNIKQDVDVLTFTIQWNYESSRQSLE